MASQLQVDLTTVHDALDDATVVSKASRDTENFNFRVHLRKKAIAKLICKNKGVFVADFLRACIDGLIRDYLPPGEFEKLQAECGEFSPRHPIKATS